MRDDSGRVQNMSRAIPRLGRKKKKKKRDNDNDKKKPKRPRIVAHKIARRANNNITAYLGIRTWGEGGREEALGGVCVWSRAVVRKSGVISK